DLGTEIAVVVQVADDGFPDGDRARIIGGEPELLVEVLVERGARAPQILERHLFALFHGHRRALVGLVEHGGAEVEAQLVRAPSAEAVSLDRGSGVAGATGVSVLAASGEAGASASTSWVSWATSSSSGFSSSSLRTTCSSSRVESCSSWMACCKSGVMTTRWV